MIETRAFSLHHFLLPSPCAQDGVAVKDRAFAPAILNAQDLVDSHEAPVLIQRGDGDSPRTALDPSDLLLWFSGQACWR